jgi:hypothetical protein
MVRLYNFVLQKGKSDEIPSFGRFLIVNAFPVFTPIIFAHISPAIFVGSRTRFTFNRGI